MRLRTAQVVAALGAALLLHADLHAQTRKKTAPARKATPKTAPAPKLECGDLVGFQVLLDRAGFSPGQIDGKTGLNFTHALAALQSAKKLQSNGQPGCDTWKALGGDSAEATVTTYTLTDTDVKGPFDKIPKLAEQSKLDALGYQSVTEEIAERFHTSPALLAELNHGTPMTAGSTIKVPAVTPFDPGLKPVREEAAADVTIDVSKAESTLRATRADGTLVFFAPVSSGSIHDPLPLGAWKVTGVAWHPVFHYNPKLFWDAKPKDEKSTIKPGPNNPVGVVWIALNLEHYGLHGTPEPGNIGHTESHGCVRLTNWDAARLAALVKPGTAVNFK
jgi:lipoprotein-anchoring transpeptidase ErfK/SrfK